jgi:hypothetical protein
VFTDETGGFSNGLDISANQKIYGYSGIPGKKTIHTNGVADGE